MKHLHKPMTLLDTLILMAIGLAAVSFLAGMDAGYRKIDKITAAERLAVYCKDAPRAMICLNPAAGGLQS